MDLNKPQQDDKGPVNWTMLLFWTSYFLGLLASAIWLLFLR